MLLFGQPNVGKSALFNALTTSHAVVSNYPGTTVGVMRGQCRLDDGREVVVHDTPGAYSLMPVTDEERIARDALFTAHPAAVLHVVDAKNLDRTLSTTLELSDAGLPVILVLNMIDESDELGILIDADELSRRLGIPVVPTVAVGGRGIRELRIAICKALDAFHVAEARERTGAGSLSDAGALWVDVFGPGVERLAAALPVAHDLPPALPPRVAAALILRGSADYAQRAGLDPEVVAAARRELQHELGTFPPVAAILGVRRRAAEFLSATFVRPRSVGETFRDRLGMLLAHPVIGLLPMAVVLYVGFYLLVGQFAAGTVVGLLEENLFGEYVNPTLESMFRAILPNETLLALFVGEYGVFTLGITYALALVLPVVGAFFLVFSLVEDSGYFPRLALLCDRFFKRVGLNGRAVVTMVLGLGCSTMATTTTRTLETGRDRVLATLLLVLTIPCSAQLGLITGLLGSRGLSLWALYVGFLVAVFFVVGFAASRVLPGRTGTFHMELVPMRMPRLGNVLKKTWLRLVWYFKEVVPLFLFASVILWAVDQTGGLAYLRTAMEPAMTLIGMPIAAAESFLIGFFRRDFGAAGLYQLVNDTVEAGGDPGTHLTDRQLLVGSVTLTLFVPCIATFMMMVKERGLRLAVVILILVTAIALATGAAANQALLGLGWQ